ncbi:MAG TPA: hypothetical protein VMH04_16210 [Candidatus Solibacter sp.]|nr:hypothetical protein [Candidatus Solibacter sp.]
MLEALRSTFSQPWKPLSRPALIAWLVFYILFLAYALNAHGAGLFIDAANLVVHEGGHNLFGWFGPTLGLWGGTLLQWLVPLLLALYFFSQRQISGFIFSLFFFFENWLYTATYMADARDQALPLVTTGDPDFVEHDWYKIFSSLGVLNQDTKIAMVVRVLGWCGMIGCVAWLALRLRESENVVQAPAVSFPKPAISLVERFPGKQKAAPPEPKPKADGEGKLTFNRRDL